MEFSYSPHREGGGTMHLPSPTHRHSYGMEIPSSLQQIRRSLSRSPSKPSRFQIRRSDSSGSTISPLALSRAFSPKSHFYDRSPVAFFPETPAAPQAKKRISLRRSTPLRCSPRNRAPSKSPRRILTDCTDHGNASPFTARLPAGEENMTDRAEHPDDMATEPRSSVRLDINDKPIKFGISRSRTELGAASPPKSTPLKRSDGIMNLDAASIGSPLAKRRSLNGPSTTDPGFDVFDQSSTTPRPAPDEPNRQSDFDFNSSIFFAPSATTTQSPLRKTSSLRKSTLSQRHGVSLNRSKPLFEPDFSGSSPAPSKVRHRMSLDLSASQGPGANQTPLRRSTHSEAFRPLSQQPFMRQSTGSQQPHPLSHALSLTPSSAAPSAASSPVEEPMADAPQPITNAPRKHLFSRSLPLGVNRPFNPIQSSESTFETPNPLKHIRQDLEGFRSTGLLSKKNRNLDVENAVNRYVMPGTPSKRASFPPVTASPSANRRGFLGKLNRPEFGQPSTPFSVHKQSSSASFGQGVSIFGTSDSRHERRSSFASIDGDDSSQSPCGNRMIDSQSSIDDMPPTPTKQGDSFGRRKDSSLRRQTFHHPRTSIGADTFAAPDAPETPQISFSTPVANGSPHTPSESFTPPDPSILSISGRRGSLPLNASRGSNIFPPATPTTPRDTNFFPRSSISLAPFVGVPENDVEVCLYERFDSFSLWGDGEFSKVYRAEKIPEKPAGFASPSAPQVYAVKKTKKPFLGPGDREKKMQEVRILEALRGNEHIVQLEDYWEHNGHLYIQTEFCEEGNLQRFLDHAGNKGRLDDFRIWKILLEITLGVRHIHDNGYIHLDLKPANILISFDGVLKIADFGLATPWPAPANIDGEGDRHYLAYETLEGRYDKPCDIFALGIIMCEIASNYSMPENGESWQRLRRGDLSDLPSLTWSTESSLDRDEKGDPIEPSPDNEDDFLGNINVSSVQRYSGGLAVPPNFMIDDKDPDSLQQIVSWMLTHNPDLRPTAQQLYLSTGCQWVERRSRAGATIFEGNWGPADDVLDLKGDDADRMDMD